MKTIILSLSFVFCSISIFSQSEFARIEKNKNIFANELSHELNASKDTLLLKSPSKIFHVQTINSKYEKELSVYEDETEVQIPLSKLSKGRHVVVVDLNPKKVVFAIQILESNSLASSTN